MSALALLFTTVAASAPHKSARFLLHISRAIAAPSLGKSVFKIVVTQSDSGHCFHYGRAQRCAAKVRVNEDARWH